ncbi:hypothetical protein SAMN05661008_01393 [Alkalithermobacter thermoalcaliphilus JW-YL-7 = DSM 7308]|uniref:Uncharacterized protein n=1 Tax=Alkalithermobacter thermoalcaliphilus JW-YL-7 = DSM 7308 TaxID=1121328 RepID=A0A150FN63_CLOPD|nr:hypothetical protein JWYL7_0148 [[Clostridium] paradoxum JW-YL-7 = DSM 7308]SHL06427.1 hypothetical protein SAMN05661008_01393 [[Clostridium] paradoxum JW-YL-7 = DSM 7308]
MENKDTKKEEKNKNLPKEVDDMIKGMILFIENIDKLDKKR